MPSLTAVAWTPAKLRRAYIFLSLFPEAVPCKLLRAFSGSATLTPTLTPSFLLSELTLNRRMSQDIFARFCKYVGPWNLKSVWCTLELSFHRNMSHDKSRKRLSKWIMDATQDQIQQAVKSSAVLAWYWIVPALRQAFHLLRVRWRRLGKASPLAHCSQS